MDHASKTDMNNSEGEGRTRSDRDSNPASGAIDHQSKHSSLNRASFNSEAGDANEEETISNLAFERDAAYTSDSSISQQRPISYSSSKKARSNSDVAYLLDDGSKSYTLLSGYKGLAILLLGAVFLMLLGILLGYLAGRAGKTKGWLAGEGDYNATLSRLLQSRVDEEFLDAALWNITRDLHQAGSRQNLVFAEKMASNWREWGWPIVTMDNYTVTLSEVDPSGPLVSLELINKASGVSIVTFNTSQLDGKLPIYHAYSPAGYAQADFVFINYGRPDDLTILSSPPYNLTLCSRRIIPIVRLGFGSRSSKISALRRHCQITAQMPGALLFYPDPEDFAGGGSGTVWPNGWWLPGDTPVFGNVGAANGGGGDLGTPGLPSNEGIYRDVNLTAKLAPFPVHPISYDDAKQFLDHLDGPRVPDAWNSSLARKIGPSTLFEVRLNVTTRLQQRPITNVLGVMPGSEEPDRYVLLGNHRDAWVFGASDPGSGTVILQEIARQLGRAYRKGEFRPRRSLLLASWDAEEQSLIGSTELTERLTRQLDTRLIAYLNIDCPVKGNWSFNARSDSLLAGPALASARQVRTGSGSETLYTDWTKKMPAVRGKPEMGPKVSSLGGGSDHIPFNYKLGVPSIYPEYRYKQWLPSMPTYHTIYDNYAIMQRFIDPGMHHHALIGRFLVDLVLRLTDSRVIPFSLTRLGNLLQVNLLALKRRVADLKPFKTGQITLKYVERVIDDFAVSAEYFQNFTSSLNASTKPLQLRMVNDILLRLPRSFITTDGLPKRPFYKNILIAPSASNAYGTSVFIGLQDALTYAIDSDTGDDWTIVMRQISVLVTCLREANQLLQGGLTGLAGFN